MYLLLGQLDTAQRFAANSVRKRSTEKTSRHEAIAADITLTTIHTLTGQSDTTTLAQHAITSIAPLQSLRTQRIKLTHSSHTVLVSWQGRRSTRFSLP